MRSHCLFGMARVSNISVFFPSPTNVIYVELQSTKGPLGVLNPSCTTCRRHRVRQSVSPCFWWTAFFLFPLEVQFLFRRTPECLASRAPSTHPRTRAHYPWRVRGPIPRNSSWHNCPILPSIQKKNEKTCPKQNVKLTVLIRREWNFLV